MIIDFMLYLPYGLVFFTLGVQSFPGTFVLVSLELRGLSGCWLCLALSMVFTSGWNSWNIWHLP